MLYNWNDTIKTSVRTSFVLSFLLQTLQRNRHFCPEGFQGMYIVIKLEMLNFNCSATCLDKDRDCWESKIVLMIWLFRFYKLGNFSYTSLATLLFSLVLQLEKNLLNVALCHQEGHEMWKTYYPPASEASREVTKLSEKKSTCTCIWCQIICPSVCLSVLS